MYLNICTYERSYYVLAHVRTYLHLFLHARVLTCALVRVCVQVCVGVHVRARIRTDHDPPPLPLSPFLLCQPAIPRPCNIIITLVDMR